MLKDVFQRLDRDKDGIVSVADVHNRLQVRGVTGSLLARTARGLTTCLQLMGQRTTRKKVETMVWEVDRKVRHRSLGNVACLR